MHNLKTPAKISIITFMLVSMIILFTGCGKSATTTDKFKSIATKNDMEVVDIIQQFERYDYVKEATIVAPKDHSYQIEFYVLSDASYAKSFFNANKAKFEMSKNDTFSENSESGKNFSKYTLTSNEKYMFLEQIDSTVLYIDVDYSNKDAVDKFIKAIKY